MSQSTTKKDIPLQFEWAGNPNSEFENWWVYDNLPDEYKQFIKGEDGFKTADPVIDPKNGGKYKYGVKSKFNKRVNAEVLQVWRVPWKEQSLSSGGSSSGSKFFPKKQAICIGVMTVDEEEANEYLKTNETTELPAYFEKSNQTIMIMEKVAIPTPADQPQRYLPERPKFYYTLYKMKKQ